MSTSKEKKIDVTKTNKTAANKKKSGTVKTPQVSSEKEPAKTTGKLGETGNVPIFNFDSESNHAETTSTCKNFEEMGSLIGGVSNSRERNLINTSAELVASTRSINNAKQLSVEFVFPESSDGVFPETCSRIKLVREYAAEYSVYIAAPFINTPTGRITVENVYGYSVFNIFRSKVYQAQLEDLIKSTNGSMLPLELLWLLSEGEHAFANILTIMRQSAKPLRVSVSIDSKLLKVKKISKDMSSTLFDILISRGGHRRHYTAISPFEWIDDNTGAAAHVISRNCMKILLSESDWFNVVSSPISSLHQIKAHLYKNNDYCFTAEGFASQMKSFEQKLNSEHCKEKKPSSKGYDAREESFELVDIDGYIVILTESRIDRETVPDGLFCYDVRHDDYGNGDACEIARKVKVNHLGTIISRREIPLDENGSYFPTEGINYLGEDTTLEDYIVMDPLMFPLMFDPE